MKCIALLLIGVFSLNTLYAQHSHNYKLIFGPISIASGSIVIADSFKMIENYNVQIVIRNDLSKRYKVKSFDLTYIKKASDFVSCHSDSDNFTSKMVAWINDIENGDNIDFFISNVYFYNKHNKVVKIKSPDNNYAWGVTIK